MNRASLGLSQPTVQRQTDRRRDLRSRFNFSFLHQSLSWLVLFLTVEVNYFIHYTYHIICITFPSQILPKSLCLLLWHIHCYFVLSYSFFCMQTCHCFCCFFFSGYFFSSICSNPTVLGWMTVAVRCLRA